MSVSGKFLSLVVVALALGAAVAGCGGKGSNGSDDTGNSEAVPAGSVALVDGQAIPKSQYDETLAQLQKSYKAQKQAFPKAGTADFQRVKENIVAFLVQREEFRLEAKKLEIEVTDADVDKRIDEVKQQYFQGDQKKFQEGLAQQGLTEAAYRAQSRDQLLSQKLFAAVTKDVEVTDDDISKYYEENKDQFKTPATRDVRHILVKSKAKADELYAEIQNGGDFAALAKQFSTDPGSKDKGGKYEDVKQGQFVAPFDKYLFSAKTHEVSEPIKTSFGWHIVEPLSEIKPESVTPLAELKDSIRQQLEGEKKNSVMNAWVKGLETKYEGKVSYAVGFNVPPKTATTGSTQSSTVTTSTGAGSTGQ